MVRVGNIPQLSNTRSRPLRGRCRSEDRVPWPARPSTDQRWNAARRCADRRSLACVPSGLLASRRDCISQQTASSRRARWSGRHGNADLRPAPPPKRGRNRVRPLSPERVSGGAYSYLSPCRTRPTPRRTPDDPEASGFLPREAPGSGNPGDSSRPPDRPRRGVRGRGPRAQPASSGWCGAPR